MLDLDSSQKIIIDPCEDQTFAPRFKEKKINVFVSSTFKDMKAERDELTLRVFPSLRKECEERGIAWGEVDLRWGIPEEKNALNICLKYIDKCRPYFIGMLGERYGWVNPKAPEEVKDDHPWVKDEADKSITELEILHGVLRNPEMAKHAYFYFRDPAYPESAKFKAAVPEKDWADYRAESPEAAGKLAALKDRIRNSGFPVRENYPDPVRFGELVKEDLIRVIDSLAPPPAPLTDAERNSAALDREDMAHEAFAASRFGVFIPRKEYFDRLDRHASGTSPPLVVLGESGSGKSALLAHWAYRYRTTHPEDLVLIHFVGASSESTDWASMLRRFMGEFKRKFSLTEEVPEKEEDLMAAFRNWLSMAGTHGRVVLVIDALNQLEDRNGAPDLVWLPPKIPENIRLIVSTLPGRPLDAVRKRGWQEMTLEPLTISERESLITCYLKKYNKELSEPVKKELASAPQCENPLYLRALIEEIRLYGEYDTLKFPKDEGRLPEFIEKYLSANTVDSLYELILSGYERSYERDRPGLVRDTAALLWAARRGLSKPELMDLLGMDGKPLPDAYWAPLYLAMEHSLVEKDGQITFFHDYLRKAVEYRYMPGEEARRTAHLTIAEYFAVQPNGKRRTDELPWQLAEAAEWDRLVALLINSSFFIESYPNSEFEIKGYWKKIENNSLFRMVEQYGKNYQNENRLFLIYLCSLMYDSGHTDEVEQLHNILISYCREHQLLNDLQGFLGNQALILFHKGDSETALNLLNEQESICCRLGDLNGVQRSLGNQSTIYYRNKKFDLALKLLRKKEQICRNLRNMDGLAFSLGKQAIILYECQNSVDESIKKFREEEHILRYTGNISGLAACLGNQAVIILDRGDILQSLKLITEQEKILEDLGDYTYLIHILNTHAVAYIRQGKYAEAMEILEKMNLYSKKIGDVEGHSISLLNKAICLWKLHLHADALSSVDESYQIAYKYKLSGVIDKIVPYREKIHREAEKK